MKQQIILFLMVFCPIGIFGQTWDYPVKPGTEEWKKMDYQEKVQRSQPSSEILKNMNTKELLDCCLEYPFNRDILLFNNPNERFLEVFNNSAVWKEFISRKDAFAVFSKFYTRKSLDDIAKITNENIRNSERFQLYFLEKVVAETSFIDNLSISDKKNLMRIILNVHLEKRKYPDEYVGFAYNSSLSALYRVLPSEPKGIRKNPEKVKSLTDNERFINNSLDREIIVSVQNFLLR